MSTNTNADNADAHAENALLPSNDEDKVDIESTMATIQGTTATTEITTNEKEEKEGGDNEDDDKMTLSEITSSTSKGWFGFLRKGSNTRGSSFEEDIVSSNSTIINLEQRSDNDNEMEMHTNNDGKVVGEEEGEEGEGEVMVGEDDNDSQHDEMEGSCIPSDELIKSIDDDGSQNKDVCTID